MSEEVTYVGKLIPIKKGTFEETAKYIVEEEMGGLEKYYNSYTEQIDDKGNGDYVMKDGIIYRIEYNGKNVFQNIFEATKNQDGTINFVLKYYNGGCGFQEAMEYALNKIK